MDVRTSGRRIPGRSLAANGPSRSTTDPTPARCSASRSSTRSRSTSTRPPRSRHPARALSARRSGNRRAPSRLCVLVRPERRSGTSPEWRGPRTLRRDRSRPGLGSRRLSSDTCAHQFLRRYLSVTPGRLTYFGRTLAMLRLTHASKTERRGPTNRGHNAASATRPVDRIAIPSKLSGYPKRRFKTNVEAGVTKALSPATATNESYASSRSRRRTKNHQAAAGATKHHRPSNTPPADSILQTLLGDLHD